MEKEKIIWKTLYLDKEDEINDIINKIKNCSEEKVVLVWPENGKTLGQENNLKLLKYYLKKEGKEAVLVSQDFSIQELGQKLQIPVVAKVQELAVSLEKTTEDQKIAAAKKPLLPIFLVGNRKKVLVSLLILVFLALGSLVYANLPWTVVEVIPATKNVEMDLLLAVSPAQQEIDLDKKIIPAKEKEEEFVFNHDFPATGIKLVGKTKSKGKIVVINEGKKAAFLPKGTIVSTLGGITFAITEDISIPKRQVEYFMGVPVGIKAGKAEANIEAAEPGAKGNVSSGEIIQVEGNSAGKLRVINPQPLGGGEDQELKVVTQEDLQKAEAGIKERVGQEISAKLSKNSGEEEIILDKSLSIKKLELGYNKKTGEEAERFTANARVKASVLLLQKYSLQKASNYWLEKTLGENYRLRDQTARIISWQGQFLAPGRYSLQVKLRGSARAKLDPQAISTQIKGISRQQAEAKLTQIPEIGYFKIETKNKNSKWLPKNSFLLKVKIKEPLGNK